MKKLFSILLVTIVAFTLTACGNKNIEGELTDIMDRLYEGIDEDNLPMALTTTKLDDETFATFAFTDKIKYKGRITLELPTGDIKKEGVTTKTIENFENIVFKRYKYYTKRNEYSKSTIL